MKNKRSACSTISFIIPIQIPFGYRVLKIRSFLGLNGCFRFLEDLRCV
jgi:hypothetical protein